MPEDPFDALRAQAQQRHSEARAAASRLRGGNAVREAANKAADAQLRLDLRAAVDESHRAGY